MTLLESTSIYYSSTWRYLTLFHSTSLFYGSTWLYLTLLHSSMALLEPTSLYFTLVWLYLTLLHCTWLYLTLLDSTTLYYVSQNLLGDILQHIVQYQWINLIPQCSWWGLVLAETHPAQWVTLYNTFRPIFKGDVVCWLFTCITCRDTACWECKTLGVCPHMVYDWLCSLDS